MGNLILYRFYEMAARKVCSYLFRNLSAAFQTPDKWTSRIL